MLVDSNILIYSIDSSSPKNKPAQKFLQDNASKLVIAHQNIFETLRVLTHHKFANPMSTADAIEALTRIANVSRIISPDHETYYIALEFIKKFNLKSNRIFDAYLAATALSHNIKTIVTDNEKDFMTYPIKVFNPFKSK